MSTNLSTHYDWLKVIPTSLLKLDNIPLFGHAPPVDLANFALSIKTFFQLNDCVIEASIPEWREKDAVIKSIGKSAVPLQFGFSSIKGTAYWIMKKDDVSALVSLMLKEKEHFADALEPTISGAFHEFLGMQILRLYLSAQGDQALIPQIVDTESLPNENALCIDIQYKVNNKKFSGTLFLTSEFQQSLKNYYLQKEGSPSTIGEKVTVTLSIEAGNTVLTKKEWASVRAGDFILLDSCPVDPDMSKGRVLITCHGISLYRGMVKKGNIKILENPLYHEVNDTMEKNMGYDDEYDESEFEESEIEESEFEESEYEDEYEDEYGEEEIKEPPKAESKSDEASKSIAPSKAPGQKGIGDPSDIPLNIIVEVARLQMSLKQLSELQPGNLLELDIKPEDGVDLVVNGRRIAKAELLKVGDALGVRILDI